MKVVRFILGLLRYAGPHLIAFILATLFGAVLTSALFYVTSPPTSSSEVRAKISDLARESVQTEVRKKIRHLTVDYFSQESLDLSVASSVFVFGTVTTEGEEIFRFLGVFQPSAPSLLDRLVGRPGFIRPTYVAIVPAGNDMDVVLSSVAVKDIDLDGNKEIFVTVKSTRADNVPTGLIILKKDSSDAWNVLGMPSVDRSLKTLIATRGLGPPSPGETSTIWFAMKNQSERVRAKERESYKRFSVSEELIDVIHSDRTTELSMLHNGGHFELLTHPETGYPQLGVVASIDDDEAVQQNHHLLVTFFRIEEKQVAVDPEWNWGKPMLSLDTENLGDIDLKEFQELGVDAHVIGKSYFSKSGFRRSIPSD